jgi:hypothetical protein
MSRAGNAGALCRLVRDGDEWKLDGVDCRNGARFNMD